MTELLDGTLVISEVLAVFALEHLEEVVNNGGRNPRRQDACRWRSRSPRTRRCLWSEWTHQGLPPLACTLPRYDQRLAISRRSLGFMRTPGTLWKKSSMSRDDDSGLSINLIQ